MSKDEKGNKLVRNFGAVILDVHGEEMRNPAAMNERIFSTVMAKMSQEGRNEMAKVLTELSVRKLTLCEACLEALRFVPEDKRTTRTAKDIQDNADLMRRINKIGVLRITADDRNALQEAARVYWGRSDPWVASYIKELLEGATPELSTADEVESENVTQLRTGEVAAAT